MQQGASKSRLKKLASRTLIAIVGVVVFVILLVGEENWRSKRAWENYKRDAAAKGDYIDRFLLNPAVVPDDQNFATIWRDLYRTRNEPSSSNVFAMRTYRSGAFPPDGISGNWRQGKLGNMAAWQKYYRDGATNADREFPTSSRPHSPGADVLLALSKSDSEIEALRMASKRPYSRYGDYDASVGKLIDQNIFFLMRVKITATLLQLRVQAELSEGKNDDAFSDVSLMLRLNDQLAEERLIISHLISLVTMNSSMQAVYEGLARHVWSASQVATLQQNLARRNFLTDWLKAMAGERAFGIRLMEEWRTSKHDFPGMELEENPAYFSRWTPKAVFYQNELALAQLQREFLDTLNFKTNTVSPESFYRADAQLTNKAANIYNSLAVSSLKAYDKMLIKSARTQGFNELAQIACGLERYRIAHGDYPESLEVLEPEYINKLPPDLINGGAWHYRNLKNGTFQLYSVGWNEKDDGGINVTDSAGEENLKGDWAWPPYPKVSATHE